MWHQLDYFYSGPMICCNWHDIIMINLKSSETFNCADLWFKKLTIINTCQNWQDITIFNSATDSPSNLSEYYKQSTHTSDDQTSFFTSMSKWSRFKWILRELVTDLTLHTLEREKIWSQQMQLNVQYTSWNSSQWFRLTYVDG